MRGEHRWWPVLTADDEEVWLCTGCGGVVSEHSHADGAPGPDGCPGWWVCSGCDGICAVMDLVRPVMVQLCMCGEVIYRDGAVRDRKVG